MRPSSKLRQYLPSQGRNRQNSQQKQIQRPENGKLGKNASTFYGKGFLENGYRSSNGIEICFTQWTYENRLQHHHLDLSKATKVEIAKNIIKAIKEGDYDKFSYVIGIVEQKIKNNEQKGYKVNKDADKKVEEEKRPIIRNHEDYMEKLSKTLDFHNKDSMLHLAVKQAVDSRDTRYLQRLIAINFPMYQEDANGHFAIFMLSKMQDDKLFIECFRLFMKRNVDITRCSKNTSSNFLELLCKSRINMIRIQEISSNLNISEEDCEKYCSLIKNQNYLSWQQKLNCIEEIKQICLLNKRKAFLFLVCKLEQRQSKHGLAKIKDGVLREIVKYF